MRQVGRPRRRRHRERRRLQSVPAAAGRRHGHAARPRRLPPLLLLLLCLLLLLRLLLLLLLLLLRLRLLLLLLRLLRLLLCLLLRGPLQQLCLLQLVLVLLVLLLGLLLLNLHGLLLLLLLLHVCRRAVVALVLRAVHRLQLGVVRPAGADVGELRAHLLLQQLLLGQLQRRAVVQRQAVLGLAQPLARQALVQGQAAAGAEAQVGQPACHQRGCTHVVHVVVHQRVVPARGGGCVYVSAAGSLAVVTPDGAGGVPWGVAGAGLAWPGRQRRQRTHSGLNAGPREGLLWRVMSG
jgi:hypothetical protein